MPLVDVLIPTYQRKTGLAIVLTSLLGQTFTDFNVIIADQTEDEHSYLDSIEIQTLVRSLEWRGHHVALHRRRIRLGMAEQRHFLLEQSCAPYVHFIDDDVLLTPETLLRMLDVIQSESCGFVGAPVPDLKYLDDIRPHEQSIELWNGNVHPEPITPESIPWDRHKVNNAANPLHVEQQLVSDQSTVRYKVAWIGGANVLYDREKLLHVGGFSWWHRLPPAHAGEEVVAQFMLIRKFGGCGVLPCGSYHLGLPTTVADRTHTAVELFGELIEEYDADTMPARADR